jgi:hypothetical protein
MQIKKGNNEKIIKFAGIILISVSSFKESRWKDEF